MCEGSGAVGTVPGMDGLRDGELWLFSRGPLPHDWQQSPSAACVFSCLIELVCRSHGPLCLRRCQDAALRRIAVFSLLSAPPFLLRRLVSPGLINFQLLSCSSFGRSDLSFGRFFGCISLPRDTSSKFACFWKLNQTPRKLRRVGPSGSRV